MKKTHTALTICAIFTVGLFLLGAGPNEKGLELTKKFAPKKAISPGSVQRKKSAVFACELDIPETPQGTIYEQGAHVRGTWVGFTKDGSFHVHAGSGFSFKRKDAAHLTIPAKKAPKGAGTLVFEIDMKTKSVRAWWNGKLLGSAKAAKEKFSSEEWAGGDKGCYGKGLKVVGNADASPFNGKLKSELRYYKNQTVK
jgi:hypothetical protein